MNRKQFQAEVKADSDLGQVKAVFSTLSSTTLIWW